LFPHLRSHLSGKDLSGHPADPSAVDEEMCCDKKTQQKTGPVMDIAHQREGKYKIHKPQCPHEESKLEESGDKTDQERHAHSEIQTPSYNLHIHENRHTPLNYTSGYVEKGDGTSGFGSDTCLLHKVSGSLPEVQINRMVTSTVEQFLAFIALFFLILWITKHRLS
jgi:hypothetical protein